MSNFEDYLALSFATYHDNFYGVLPTEVRNDLLSIVNDYNPIIIENYTDKSGFYERENFACAAYKNGNKIIISFRGTDDDIDKYFSDIGIYLNKIPKKEFNYAEEYYLKIKEQYPEAEIEFTGHSLGGAIAQLMGAKYGYKTVTFNAPGMLNMLDQIGCSTTDSYNNITNYVVLNDYVGNFGTHSGETYYIPPIPLNKDALLDTHAGIFAYNETTHGQLISSIPGFTQNHAWALWAYDEKNNDNVIKPVILTKLTSKDLYDAAILVEKYLGSKGNLPNTIKCKSKNQGFVIGSNTEKFLVGWNDTDDIIWSNGGYSNMGGGSGNDQLFGTSAMNIFNGGPGNDYLSGWTGEDIYWFFTGDGQDRIVDGEESKLSSKNIRYNAQLGQVLVNNVKLTGGTYNEETGTYISDDVGVTYEWTGYNGSPLIIKYGNNDSIKIENFKNGDLEIYFDISWTLEDSSISEYLKKGKQGINDLFLIRSIEKEVPHLKYHDSSSGKIYDVINCETTDKLINAYGKEFLGGILVEAGNYILIEENQKITLNHTPVDHSILINDMQDKLNGIEKPETDLAIQGDIQLPKSSAEGSPTLQDVYYQYTTKPSGGGILPGLFTLVQMAFCLVTQQWWGAAMVALRTGIAGEKVGKIAGIVDQVYGVANMFWDTKNLGGIFKTIGGKKVRLVKVKNF